MVNKHLNNFQTSLFDGIDSQLQDKEPLSHDSDIEITPVNQDEIKNAEIKFSFQTTRFGNTLLSSTHSDICYLGFFDLEKNALSELKNNFFIDNKKNKNALDLTKIKINC